MEQSLLSRETRGAVGPGAGGPPEQAPVGGGRWRREKSKKKGREIRQKSENHWGDRATCYLTVVFI